jgi:hypothetical protein
MATVTDVGAGLGGLPGLCGVFDGVSLEVTDLVPVGTKCGVAAEAVVLEHVLDLVPWAGQTHDLLGWHLAMALEASGFRIDLLPQRESGVGLGRGRRRRSLGLLARIVALMAGVAAQVHQLLGQRGHQVPAMESCPARRCKCW